MFLLFFVISVCHSDEGGISTFKLIMEIEIKMYINLQQQL